MHHTIGSLRVTNNHIRFIVLLIDNIHARHCKSLGSHIIIRIQKPGLCVRFQRCICASIEIIRQFISAQKMIKQHVG